MDSDGWRKASGRFRALSWVSISPIGGEPGNVFPQDQGVDVMGPLVGFYGFKVAQVSAALILLHDSIGAENVARGPGCLKCHGHVVSLGKGDLLVPNGAFVFQGGKPVTAKLGSRYV